MRKCWRREEVQESQGPRVPRSRGPKVPGSKGPRYLKLTFKYELDSKEGPSCVLLFLNNILQIRTMGQLWPKYFVLGIEERRGN